MKLIIENDPGLEPETIELQSIEDPDNIGTTIEQMHALFISALRALTFPEALIARCPLLEDNEFVAEKPDDDEAAGD